MTNQWRIEKPHEPERKTLLRIARAEQDSVEHETERSGSVALTRAGG